MPCRPSAPISGHRSRGKVLVAVDLVGARRDLVLREAARRSCAACRRRRRGRNRSPPRHWGSCALLRRLGRRAGNSIGCDVTLSAPRATPARGLPACLACASSRSIALAGAGLANRKPCISSQPASRSSTRCSSVSTPSTSTVRPSARPSATIAWMITPPLADWPSAATKLRSILSLSKRKALQIAQIGIAGAEIVERDAHAERVQILDALDHLVRIVDQHAFGDFQHQPRRRARRFRPAPSAPDRRCARSRTCSGDRLTAT